MFSCINIVSAHFGSLATDTIKNIFSYTIPTNQAAVQFFAHFIFEHHKSPFTECPLLVFSFNTPTLCGDASPFALSLGLVNKQCYTIFTQDKKYIIDRYFAFSLPKILLYAWNTIESSRKNDQFYTLLSLTTTKDLFLYYIKKRKKMIEYERIIDEVRTEAAFHQEVITQSIQEFHAKTNETYKTFATLPTRLPQKYVTMQVTSNLPSTLVHITILDKREEHLKKLKETILLILFTKVFNPFRNSNLHFDIFFHCLPILSHLCYSRSKQFTSVDALKHSGQYEKFRIITAPFWHSTDAELETVPFRAPSNDISYEDICATLETYILTAVGTRHDFTFTPLPPPTLPSLVPSNAQDTTLFINTALLSFLTTYPYFTGTFLDLEKDSKKYLTAQIEASSMNNDFQSFQRVYEVICARYVNVHRIIYRTEHDQLPFAIREYLSLVKRKEFIFLVPKQHIRSLKEKFSYHNIEVLHFIVAQKLWNYVNKKEAETFDNASRLFYIGTGVSNFFFDGIPPHLFFALGACGLFDLIYSHSTDKRYSYYTHKRTLLDPSLALLSLGLRSLLTIFILYTNIDPEDSMLSRALLLIMMCFPLGAELYTSFTEGYQEGFYFFLLSTFYRYMKKEPTLVEHIEVDAMEEENDPPL